MNPASADSVDPLTTIGLMGFSVPQYQATHCQSGLRLSLMYPKLVYPTGRK